MAAILAMMPGPAWGHANAIGIARAVAIAERATGGNATDAELDRESGDKLVYEIELVKGRTLHRVEIDARSGRILSLKTPPIAGYWTRWFNSAVLREAAHARPLSTILGPLESRTGGEVLEASFFIEAGRSLYKVRISTRAGVADIYLDPGTGKRLALVLDD